MMDNEAMRMWEEAARLQEFRTRGSGYAGPSRPDAAAKAAEAAHVKHMHDTITANGAKLDAERAAAVKAAQDADATRIAMVTHPAYKPPTRTGLPETAAEQETSRAKRIAALRKRNQK